MESVEQDKPLVSIIVITYNSSKYVLETLESAKAQTYQNIELIISDDGSKDETMEICKNWLEENQKRFVRTELITVEKNTGIPANCNRGVKISKGEWVKLIAGDDLFTMNSIEYFVNFANIHSIAEIIFSNILIGKSQLNSEKLISFFNNDNKGQYIKLLEGNILPAPGFFVKLSVLNELNGFDERYNLIEDFPFYLKALKNGKRFFFLDQPLIIYRKDSNGISNLKIMNIAYQNSIKMFFNEIFLPELRRNRKYLHYFHYQIEYLLLTLTVLGFIKSHRNYHKLLKLFSILNWYSQIKKIKLN